MKDKGIPGEDLEEVLFRKVEVTKIIGVLDVPPGESSLAVRASISSVSCMKLYVSISAAFMFE